MAKFISILNSDIENPYWKAIQWDDSLASIEANIYYTAGVNLNVPKSDGDQSITTKTVKEISTFSEGIATVIRLNKATDDLL